MQFFPWHRQIASLVVDNAEKQTSLQLQKKPIAFFWLEKDV